MKFSIITVCYNSVTTIRDTIESVLSQTHQDIEYIVVDGNSSDGSQSVIGEYLQHISHYVSEPDGGIYDAMNKGILQATGDVITFLNADDVYMDQGVISLVASSFEEQVDVVFGDLVYVHPDNGDKVVRYYSAKLFRPWMLRFGWMPPHPATFIRRKVYDSLGGYQTDYSIAADYEFMVRMLYCHTTNNRWVNAVLVKMRTGGISTRNIASSLLLNQEIVRACRENDLYTNFLFLTMKLPFKLWELVSFRIFRRKILKVWRQES